MITFDETVQTVLNLLQKLQETQAKVIQQDAHIKHLEEKIMQLEAPGSSRETRNEAPSNGSK